MGLGEIPSNFSHKNIWMKKVSACVTTLYLPPEVYCGHLSNVTYSYTMYKWPKARFSLLQGGWPLKRHRNLYYSWGHSERANRESENSRSSSVMPIQHSSPSWKYQTHEVYVELLDTFRASCKSYKVYSCSSSKTMPIALWSQNPFDILQHHGKLSPKLW